MEAFIGTWKLIKDEDYGKYLRETGAGGELIAVSNVLKPLITISQDDDIVEMKIQSGIGTEELVFQLGREFHRQHKDGRYCKVVVELEGDKLIKVEKWENANATSIIEVKDGKLIQDSKVFSVLFDLKDELQRVAVIVDPGHSTSSIKEIGFIE